MISFYNHESSLNSFSLCKIKCETDFVAKNDDFLSFANQLTKAIHESDSIKTQGNFEDISSISFNEKDLNSALTDLISKIGENIQIISYKKYHSDNSIFINYLHNKYNSSCSKIASVVEISTNDTKKASEIADDLKVIAMQVSAMKPMGLNEGSIDPKVLEDEKDIILKQIENTPDDRKEQIVKGKLNKFLKENTLMGQALITDPKNTVANYVSDLSKSNNLELNIVQWIYILFKMYKNIMLKISGESLAGDNEQGFDFDILNDLSQNIKTLASKDIKISIVLGGGNFIRGSSFLMELLIE